MMDWKGFGRKRPWLYSWNFPRETEEHHVKSDREAGVTVEIRTEYEPIVLVLR
jgi:hypothetical protein